MLSEEIGDFSVTREKLLSKDTIVELDLLIDMLLTNRLGRHRESLAVLLLSERFG